MIFPGFPGVLSFFQVFQVFQVEWEPWVFLRNSTLWSRICFLKPIATSGGRPRPSPPHMAQNFLNFMRFFGNFWQNRRLAPPPTGNPGSTPSNILVSIHKILLIYQ